MFIRDILKNLGIRVKIFKIFGMGRGRRVNFWGYLKKFEGEMI